MDALEGKFYEITAERKKDVTTADAETQKLFHHDHVQRKLIFGITIIK